MLHSRIVLLTVATSTLAVPSMNLCIGRKCDDPSCRGDLADTIINFGENLPQSKDK